MKVYLASRFSRQAEMRTIRDRLTALGHEVTSRWLDTEWEGRSEAPPEYRDLWAKNNYTDVLLCDVILNFTEQPSSGSGRGGRHVEFGLAAAWGKRLIVIGYRENVFHHLPAVEFYETLEQALCSF